MQRAISESLTNIAHHAQAQHVRICTSVDSALLTIVIHDDGIGFDPAEVSDQVGHYGLLGLRERARLMGGELMITSSPGAGTSIQIQFPRQRREKLS